MTPPTLSVRAIWSLSAFISVPVLALSSWSFAAAGRTEIEQAKRLDRERHEVAHLHELESSLPAWMLVPKPTGALASLVSAALSASGLPGSAMASLSADSESAGPSGLVAPSGPNVASAGIRVAQRHATLVLTGITLPQLGAFLKTWRDQQPAWAVVQLDVSPTPESLTPANRNSSASPAPTAAAAPTPTTGGDLPLHAVIVLESDSLQGTLPSASASAASPARASPTPAPLKTSPNASKPPTPSSTPASPPSAKTKH